MPYSLQPIQILISIESSAHLAEQQPLALSSLKILSKNYGDGQGFPNPKGSIKLRRFTETSFGHAKTKYMLNS